MSANVFETSPGCIGNNFFFAFKFKVFSINLTNSNNTSGLLLPKL